MLMEANWYSRHGLQCYCTLKSLSHVRQKQTSMTPKPFEVMFLRSPLQSLGNHLSLPLAAMETQ